MADREHLIQTAKDILDMLTKEERVEIFSGYCLNCGSDWHATPLCPRREE